MDDTPQNVQEDEGDRATALYAESLAVSLGDQQIRAENVDASHEKSDAQIVALRKQSLRLLSRLRQLDARLSKLPAQVGV